MTLTTNNFDSDPDIHFVPVPELSLSGLNSIQAAAKLLREPDSPADVPVYMISSFNQKRNELFVFPARLRWKIAMANFNIRQHTVGTLMVAVLLEDEDGNMLWRKMKGFPNFWHLSAASFISSTKSFRSIAQDSLWTHLNLEPQDYMDLEPLVSVHTMSDDLIFLFRARLKKNKEIATKSLKIKTIEDLLWMESFRSPSNLSTAGENIFHIYSQLKK